MATYDSSSSFVRLRKAFKAPTEDDEVLEDLDEQQQEQLISTLQANDSSTNALYQNLFTGIALASILPCLIWGWNMSLGVLAATSLIASAYTLQYLPLPKADGSNLMKDLMPDGGGPIEKYLSPLNAVLAAIIAFSGYTSRHVNTIESVILHTLPLIIFTITTLVRMQLRPVNVEELSRLKYDYKGA